jgi:hypothetical protein
MFKNGLTDLNGLKVDLPLVRDSRNSKFTYNHFVITLLEKPNLSKIHGGGAATLRGNNKSL